MFNLLGAVWARLVPTVIALAFYFTISDCVLILQCLYYSHWAKRSDNGPLDGAEEPAASAYGSSPSPAVQEGGAGARETDPLLGVADNTPPHSSADAASSRLQQKPDTLDPHLSDSRTASQSRLKAMLRVSFVNTTLVLAVCGVGALGWFIAYKTGAWVAPPPENDAGDNDDKTPFGAELLGYLSAVLYLGARVPQILKNWREKSCEGLSLLFFLLSLLGNLTYGGGILAHSLQKQYVLTNVPWLLGSLGTMVEDITIFIQFHLYRRR